MGGRNFVARSGGGVLAAVSRFTGKAFQLEYLGCMAAREHNNKRFRDEKKKKYIKMYSAELIWGSGEGERGGGGGRRGGGERGGEGKGGEKGGGGNKKKKKHAQGSMFTVYTH